MTHVPNHEALDHLQRGLMHQSQDNHTAAIDAFTEAIQLQPIADAYYYRARSHHHLQNWDAAIEDYSAAIRHDPDYSTAYEQRAIAREARGDAFIDSGKRGSPTAEYRNELGIMLSPYLIGTLLLVLGPALYTFWLAFHQYNGLTPPVYVGDNNFQFLWNDREFKLSLLSTLIFLSLAVPLRIVGALLLALLLKNWRRGVGMYRVSVFLPTVIPDVAYALIWLWILNPVYGPLNKLLELVGIDGPAWLNDPWTAMLGLVLMAGFTIGEGFIVFLAGLQSIPRDYYEAAAVDGASWWGKFRRITFPMLKPWLVLMIIRDIIVSSQNSFVPGLIMTDLGKPYTNINTIIPASIAGDGPQYTTRFVPLVVYERAYEFLLFGHASAMMVIVYAMIGVMLFVVYRLLRGWGYEGDH